MYPYKKLLKTALIASPIMGIPTILPSFSQANFSVEEVAKSLSLATLAMLSLWMINIGLIKLLERNQIRYLRYILSIVSIFVISCIFTSLFDFPIRPPHVPPEGTLPMHMFMNGKPPGPGPMGGRIPFSIFISQFNNFMVLFIIDLLISRNREKIAADENGELKIKNLEAQQLQLRQQIQPHFLFNSLNTLKSLISDHPAEAEEYLVKLSSFLRYNLSSNDHDLIPLKDELKICFDYLEIQKVRFKEGLIYSIDIEDEVIKNAKLPTFAIQLLIENAIKHNVLTAKNPLIIEISITDKKEIRVCNNLQEKSSTENSMQIGLKNLSERYKLLIKKDITINKTTHKFEVLLPLDQQ
ncbi:MAG: sensor histidine kinase [Bacteroidia bacterium]